MHYLLNNISLKFYFSVKLQLKQHALRSIFYQLLRAHPGFFKLDGGGFEKYVYDSGSMFFYPDKILNDDETRSLEITAVSYIFIEITIKNTCLGFF